jgi:sensor histidine kinase YesM
VPGFLLQPIVENAIYHAIAVKPMHGCIVISSTVDEGQLTVSVEDDGPGSAVVRKRTMKEGVGLKITKERLAHLYGAAHSFVIEPSNLGGMKVSITLPLRTETLTEAIQ